MELLTCLVVFQFVTLVHLCPDATWMAGSDPDTCYKITEGRVSWHAAREWCGQHGGYLAEINTEAEQRFLETILR